MFSPKHKEIAKMKTQKVLSTAEQKSARSMAAYKAHATRQRNLIEAANHAEIKAIASKSLKAIQARMAALTPKSPRKAKVSAPVSAPVVSAAV
jgi:hypothetical protein